MSTSLGDRVCDAIDFSTPTISTATGGGGEVNLDEKRKRRQNYSWDDRMRDAVKYWFDQQGLATPITETPLLTKAQIANKFKVNLPTFRRYTRADPSKRQSMGQSRGRKKIISDDNINIIIDFANLLIQSNDGQYVKKIINKIVELEQQLTKMQAEGFYHKTLKRKIKLLRDASKVVKISESGGTVTSKSSVTWNNEACSDEFGENQFFNDVDDFGIDVSGVHPNIDPKQRRVRGEGAKSLSVATTGTVTMETAMTTMGNTTETVQAGNPPGMQKKGDREAGLFEQGARQNVKSADVTATKEGGGSEPGEVNVVLQKSDAPQLLEGTNKRPPQPIHGGTIVTDLCTTTTATTASLTDPYFSKSAEQPFTEADDTICADKTNFTCLSSLTNSVSSPNLRKALDEVTKEREELRSEVAAARKLAETAKRDAEVAREIAERAGMELERRREFTERKAADVAESNFVPLNDALAEVNKERQLRLRQEAENERLKRHLDETVSELKKAKRSASLTIAENCLLKKQLDGEKAASLTEPRGSQNSSREITDCIAKVTEFGATIEHDNVDCYDAALANNTDDPAAELLTRTERLTTKATEQYDQDDNDDEELNKLQNGETAVVSLESYQHSISRSVNPEGCNRCAAETVEAKSIAGKKQKQNILAMTHLLPLTFEEEAIVIESTDNEGPPNEILAIQDGISVTRKSMQTLRPRQKLNDEIVNFFLKVCLDNHDRIICADQSGRKRSHFFNSFFVQTMFDEKNTQLDLRGIYKYENVKNWSKRVPDGEIFNLKHIFCPINIDNSHWTLAVIFMEEKRIQYYDSLGATDMSKLEGLLQYVKDEKENRHGVVLDASEWKLVGCSEDTPLQDNGYDCGVFTCMFCDFLSKDYSLDFNQDDIDPFRKRITLSIKKYLLVGDTFGGKRLTPDPTLCHSRWI